MTHAPFLLTFLLAVTTFTNAQTSPGTSSCTDDIKLNNNYSKADSLQSILKRYAEAGIPGISMAIYSEREGWWAGAAGYARLEDKTPMDICRLHYTQSISKSYMAVVIMKLQELGKIKYDEPMTSYLPAKYAKHIKDPSRVTVRMLLNHTSGVPDYAVDPEFVGLVMNHPLQYQTSEDCLKSISLHPFTFEPGSDYKYSNTNYLLLALIADKISGDHTALIDQYIFKPLGIKNTFYKNDHNYLQGKYTTDSYWDIIGEGHPTNVSEMQKVNVASLKGDDGMAAAPTDVVKYLKGLMEGKLLSPASMKELTNWVHDKSGKPRYGMGLIHFQLGEIVAYGHGGGGIGSSCMMLYLPSKNIYAFFSTNVGVLTENDLVRKIDALKNELLATLLK